MKSIRENLEDKRSDKILSLWLATHMDGKGIKAFLKDRNIKSVKKEVSDEEANENWNRFIKDVNQGKFNA